MVSVNHVFEPSQPRYDIQYLRIRQVLKHFTDQAKITIRQVIIDDVGADKAHLLALIEGPVLLHQRLDDVDADIGNVVREDRCAASDFLPIVKEKSEARR